MIVGGCVVVGVGGEATKAFRWRWAPCLTKYTSLNIFPNKNQRHKSCESGGLFLPARKVPWICSASRPARQT